MIKVVLSHDIDRTKKTYQFFTKPVRELLKGNFKSFTRLLGSFFKSGNYWTFKDIIDIENSYNVKSTFFFLNETIRFNFMNPKTFVLAFGRYNIEDPKIVKVIRMLNEGGWEIGVHGSFNSFCNLDLLIKEKQILERIVGSQVEGIRQHHLNMSAETWSLQSTAGFKYDSSHGSNYRNGFIDHRIAPFHPLESDFIVFPQVLMDKCFLESKTRWSDLDEYLNICENENAVFVVNFHNHTFNEIEYPGSHDTYRKIIETCQKRNAVFYKFSDLLGSF